MAVGPTCQPLLSLLSPLSLSLYLSSLLSNSADPASAAALPAHASPAHPAGSSGSWRSLPGVFPPAASRTAAAGRWALTMTACSARSPSTASPGSAPRSARRAARGLQPSSARGAAAPPGAASSSACRQREQSCGAEEGAAARRGDPAAAPRGDENRGGRREAGGARRRRRVSTELDRQGRRGGARAPDPPQQEGRPGGGGWPDKQPSRGTARARRGRATRSTPSRALAAVPRAPARAVLRLLPPAAVFRPRSPAPRPHRARRGRRSGGPAGPRHARLARHSPPSASSTRGPAAAAYRGSEGPPPLASRLRSTARLSGRVRCALARPPGPRPRPATPAVELGRRPASRAPLPTGRGGARPPKAAAARSSPARGLLLRARWPWRERWGRAGSQGGRRRRGERAGKRERERGKKERNKREKKN